MKYSLMLSVLFYICGCFYMFFGIYAIVADVKSRVNRLFLLLTISMAIWSFAYSISNSAPTAEMSAFWRSSSVFGWGVFHSILVHFILILTKNKALLNKQRSTLILLYLPTLINIVLFAPFGYLATTQYKMVQTDFGWTNVLPMNIWGGWLSLYHIVFSTIGIRLLIRWWKELEPRTLLKRQLSYFLISMLFPFIAGMVIDTMPGIFEIKLFPKLEVVFNIIPMITLYFILKNSGVLLERSRIVYVFPKTDKDPGNDRLRLFQTTAVIFMIGAALSFLVGYFGVNRKLEYELSLSIAIFLFGIFTGFIPVITRNHNIQNTIFLAVCTLGFLFFMITNADTGAVTIWSTYILFLLVTVVLDSRIHAFIFTILCIVIQVGFWIARSKVAVIIDGTEYVTRIITIVLSYFTVRYLTTEYALKVKEHRRFAREQETLEKISTNFIAINSENAKDRRNV